VKYLHTMIRISDEAESLDFWCNKLGLKEIRRREVEAGRFTLIFLGAEENPDAQIELTYNWDPEDYSEGRNFGHVAYEVDDIHATCKKLMDAGVTINRPPREGKMAFIRSPDNISVELLQKGDALEPAEPWVSVFPIRPPEAASCAPNNPGRLSILPPLRASRSRAPWNPSRRPEPCGGPRSWSAASAAGPW